MSFAIIETGGKQYRVSTSKILEIENLENLLDVRGESEDASEAEIQALFREGPPGESGTSSVPGVSDVERLIDVRITLSYLGVSIRDMDYLFDENESVVNISTIQFSKLHKHHTALSFHKVREAKASKILIFHHIPGVIKPADILGKHWGYSHTSQKLVDRIINPITDRLKGIYDTYPETEEED